MTRDVYLLSLHARLWRRHQTSPVPSGPQPAALLLSGVLMNNLDALPEQHIWAAVRHSRAVLGEEVVMTELKRRQFVTII